MWVRSYSKLYKGITRQQIWKLWTNVNQWPLWDHDIEYCNLDGPFEVGASFILKPKGAPKVTVSLIAIENEKMFTDCTVFFGAKMYGKHELSLEGDELRLTTTMMVTGILKYLWIRLVAQGIVDMLPEQMDTLVQQAFIQEG